jgi:hypothetical protein
VELLCTALDASFDVPALGGATTPVAVQLDGDFGFTSFSALETRLNYSSAAGRAVESLGFSAESDEPHPVFRQLAMAAGDQVSLSGTSPHFYFVVSYFGGQTGTFSHTGRLEFLAPPPAIASGDANGDGVFDLVDIAIWQRKLAGLPVEL